MKNEEARRYRTAGNIEVRVSARELPAAGCIEPIVDALDSHLGVVLASSYEYPGRYSRWDIGFFDPPLQITSRDRYLRISALNDRGKVMLRAIVPAVVSLPAVDVCKLTGWSMEVSIRAPEQYLSEEQRSRQWTVFSVLRRLVELFFSSEDRNLGLYGAFGYDLAFQFENVECVLPRGPDKRDLVLFVPDEMFVVDHRKQQAFRYRYEFKVESESTEGLARTGSASLYAGRSSVPKSRDHQPGEFAALVATAKDSFRRGDLFEVVPSQVFYYPAPQPPSGIYRRLREINPSPYGTLMNLGENEYLIGASPEMFLRSEGRRIETCPISGTVARGHDAMSDADQVLRLLNSEKECSELTMCTDVDRNDKARVCEPGSVRVIGRRQIEMYSRVIHTVDHVEGTLRENYDAIDAFLSHAWAVTVTGAPKLWAMRFIERHERSCRHWYGGAIGTLGFDGRINTGLTLRTIRVKDGIGEVRAGATLLMDADPESEEQETELKASALVRALTEQSTSPAQVPRSTADTEGRTRVLLMDHEDSFVNTLADYFRQAGADVATMRPGCSEQALTEQILSSKAEFLCLSPGPGSPSDFNMMRTIKIALRHNLPIFGVCLGLQAMAEYFGSRLGRLDYPMHGKPSLIKVLAGKIFAGLPESFSAGRYHSLHVIQETLSPDLLVTAISDDGIIMALEHRFLPLAAVQFHPESIMSLSQGVGLRIIQNALRSLKSNFSASAA
jgi:anthranilate synthase